MAQQLVNQSDKLVERVIAKLGSDKHKFWTYCIYRISKVLASVAIAITFGVQAVSFVFACL
jgi:hypothetical protein